MAKNIRAYKSSYNVSIVFLLMLQIAFLTRGTTTSLVYGFVVPKLRSYRCIPTRRSVGQSTKPLMAIVDDVTAAMKVAMKAKDTTTLGTIRLIRTAFANAAIELRAESLSDEQAQTVLRKMAKMRKESIDMFEKGGATDRADMERAELAVIEQYLPAAVSDDVVREWAQDAIKEVGSTDNVGKIMGAFMKKHKTDVDGSIAQRIVKEEIAKAKES